MISAGFYINMTYSCRVEFGIIYSEREQNEDRQAYRNAAGASAGSENYGTGILAVSD